MLRILFAALAGGIVLRMWSVISAAVLPWPMIAVGSMPPPKAALTASIPTADVAVVATAAPTPALAELESQSAETASADETPPLPTRGYYRSAAYPPAAAVPWRQVYAELTIALLATLMVASIPPQTAWPRQVALIGLGATSSVLLCNFSQAARLDWPTDYVWLLCVDHVISMATMSLVALCVLRLHWPRWQKRLSSPPATLEPQAAPALPSSA